MELPVARGHVVCDKIAEDMFWCGFGSNVLRGLADHHTEFDLVIELLCNAWLYVFEWTCQARGLFVKPELLAWGANAGPRGFLEVSLVIHTNGQILSRLLDRRKQPHFLKRNTG